MSNRNILLIVAGILILSGIFATYFNSTHHGILDFGLPLSIGWGEDKAVHIGGLPAFLCFAGLVCLLSVPRVMAPESSHDKKDALIETLRKELTSRKREVKTFQDLILAKDRATQEVLSQAMATIRRLSGGGSDV